MGHSQVSQIASLINKLKVLPFFIHTCLRHKPKETPRQIDRRNRSILNWPSLLWRISLQFCWLTLPPPTLKDFTFVLLTESIPQVHTDRTLCLPWQHWKLTTDSSFFARPSQSRAFIIGLTRLLPLKLHCHFDFIRVQLWWLLFLPAATLELGYYRYCWDLRCLVGL